MADSTSTVTLPPGYALEQPQSSGVTPPPGYTVEGSGSGSTATPPERFSDWPPPKTAPVIPPQDHKEELVKSIAGEFGLSTYRSARDTITKIEGLIKSPSAAYAAARQEVQNIGANLKDTVTPEPYDLDPAHHQVRASPITPFPGVGGAAGEFADEAVASTASKGPGLVQKAIQGEKVAQAPAQGALQSAAKAGAAESGASTVAPQSLREAMTAPIDSVESAAKQNYQSIDAATDGKFQPNADKLNNVNNKLKSIAGTDDVKEAELLASKTRLEWQQEKLFDEAAANGVPKEVVDTARGQFKQGQAMRDLETKVFKNPSVVAGNAAHGTAETVNVDRAVTALQKLQDNTEFGSPRLEQALGKQGAKQILDDLYSVQRLGVKALKQQQIAKWIGAIVAGAAAVEGASMGAKAISGH